ncbi:hypothetical protein [Mesorhizobium silamurunense]|uniref:hypothetical protein n=1 Tax=Mesorhizobium silamurunense TaxID=499528 RepID=UPI00177C88FE|nr:hypothetical protein [Mesorhizobium silamurunense]
MSIDRDLCYMPAPEIAGRFAGGDAVNPLLLLRLSGRGDEALSIAEELDHEAKAGKFRGRDRHCAHALCHEPESFVALV